MVEEILSSACSDTSDSQLSALLSIRRNLLDSQEERPSSMLKSVEDSLRSTSKELLKMFCLASPSSLSSSSDQPLQNLPRSRIRAL